MLETIAGGTRLTVRHAGIAAPDQRNNIGAGWRTSFDQLSEILSNRSASRHGLRPRDRGAHPKVAVGRSDMLEKKMFGGLCFMVRGHMCCAVSGRGGLLVRVGPDAPPSMLREPHAARWRCAGASWADMSRRAGRLRDRAGLKKWVTRGVDFVAAMPKAEGVDKKNVKALKNSGPIKTSRVRRIIAASSSSNAARPRRENPSAAPAARRYRPIPATLRWRYDRAAAGRCGPRKARAEC